MKQLSGDVTVIALFGIVRVALVWFGTYAVPMWPTSSRVGAAWFFELTTGGTLAVYDFVAYAWRRRKRATTSAVDEARSSAYQ